ncbi:hypothetical protein F4803DRAFT_525706 [Xylaria telfairii]|nr:hypothetical protein F4803DRAFT_525706 [Xylaria telfairii]
MAQRIEVDESTWFPFFSRDRWYDLDQGFPDTIVGTDGTTWQTSTWSARDDRVWNVLRFTLEIANRILKTLIRDNNKWLGTLLYGRVQSWYELHSDPVDYHKHVENRYRILMNPETERAICERKAKPFLGRDIEPDAQKRHDLVIVLLEGLVWGFMASTEIGRGRTNYFYMGTRADAICRINPNLLALLCGDTISIAERCATHMKQAITVLHELMHALFKGRYNYDENLSPEVLKELSQGKQRFEEPYIEGEPIKEVGRSFEAAVFGGTPADGPSRHGGKYAPNIPMLRVNIKYPSLYAGPGQTGMDNHPSLKPGAPVELSLIPAAVLWRLQSKAFWDITPPNGQTGFLLPSLFTTAVSTERFSERYLYRPVTVNPDAASGVRFGSMIDRWNKQLSVWSARRPWYDSARRTWLKTPWGYMDLRRRIEIFLAAYKARDEAACAAVAWNLETMIPWKNIATNTGSNAIHFMPRVSSTTGNPPIWLFHCLSLLMCAALPLRTADHVVSEGGKKRITVQLQQTGKTPFLDFISVLGQAERTKKVLKGDWYYSRLSDAKDIQVSRREEFVSQALKIIDYFGRTRRVYIYKAFFTALRNLASYLFRQLRAPGFDQLSWLPRFPFKVPAYQPFTFVKWDQESSYWKDVEKSEQNLNDFNDIPEFQ